MDAKVYGSENKEAVVEIERMLRRDEHASRVVNDQAIRRKRERFAFGLTAFLAAAVVCGVLFLNAGKPGLAVRLHFANLLVDDEGNVIEMTESDEFPFEEEEHPVAATEAQWAVKANVFEGYQRAIEAAGGNAAEIGYQVIPVRGVQWVELDNRKGITKTIFDNFDQAIEFVARDDTVEIYAMFKGEDGAAETIDQRVPEALWFGVGGKSDILGVFETYSDAWSVVGENADVNVYEAIPISYIEWAAVSDTGDIARIVSTYEEIIEQVGSINNPEVYLFIPLGSGNGGLRRALRA